MLVLLVKHVNQVHVNVLADNSYAMVSVLIQHHFNLIQTTVVRVVMLVLLVKHVNQVHVNARLTKNYSIINVFQNARVT